jgi:hypothetical protein
MNHPCGGSAGSTRTTAEGFLDDRDADLHIGQVMAGLAVWPHGGTKAPESAPSQDGDTGHV